jgi:hypothetical protein
MKHHWALDFFNLAKPKGIKCSIERMMHGWVETVNFGDNVYFTKSVTYDLSRRHYFQGVDPSKLLEKGNYILFCGGRENILTDIFIIPWGSFFNTIEKGESINTYKPPKEYFQYKLYLRDRNDRWLMNVQGGNRPVLDVMHWHYNVAKALEFIASE